ncbi:class I SAM-dependent methyltransferase [Bacillus aquiflavi]|uniref:Class I SAM-dependent methyltransferase n=1 Tax=Bacillus aquiflavi TaxID=2672567 RepID=A0A6B3W071_9BACI|nr:class I SAM-dependent methyltransferase [Bacillus aquiflavi]MBA4536894.1 class I SAM-dependent methyltransferase [Bacillus aquiflavi]NEY81261.1 methyltransferase domain-containing protein [Bacillus aquiflavi]UAC47628.1 methyltransferase domain-containing protein [Bacillus aquiflavi]
MKLEKILQFARSLMEKAVQKGDVVVDGTLGNGHDTLFLANLVGSNGKVFGFDIQEKAVKITEKRLAENGVLRRASLHHIGHEHISEVISPDYTGKISGAMFNLGYLPGGNKEIVTKPKTTIKAIEQLLQLMASEGVIVLVIYHGHEEGALEREAVLQYVKNLDQSIAHVLQYQFINQVNNPPFIIAIEKK